MKDSRLNICVVPMEISWGDKDNNLSRLDSILSGVHPATDLVVLPETFSTGFPSPASVKESGIPGEETGGDTITTVKRLARRYNLAIAGSFIAVDNGKYYNRAFFIEPTGDTYFADKAHLFSMAGEDELFDKGYRRMTVRYRSWNISMVICYDIRFPIWCRNRNNEYDLLLIVANWPKVRIDAWNKLLYARAIENQAYVAGVNCRGIDLSGFEYDGSSKIIDFKGKEIASQSDDLLYASLSLEKLESFRTKFPAWKDADDFILRK